MKRLELAALPRARDGTHFLYAVEFDGGLTKVGSTRGPRTRMELLFHRSIQLGLGPMRSLYMHGFPDRHGGFIVERRMVQAITAMAPPTKGREWFRDMDYLSIVGVVKAFATAYGG